MNEIIFQITLTIIIIVFLLFLLKIFLLQKKAKKLFGDGICNNKECDKPQKYISLDSSFFGRIYLCSHCGTLIYFPLDLSKPKETLLDPFRESEDQGPDEVIENL